MKGEDLTGKRFGRLVAVKPTQERKNRSVVWECLCDCGETAYIRRSSLVAGTTRSCGCLKNAEDITGQKFGNLTVVRPTERLSGTSRVWECKCDCGNIVCVPVSNLKSGNTKSCGCSKFVNLAGQRFGRLTALHPTERYNFNGQRLWECRCDCGNVKYLAACNLINGSTKSCGCLNRENITRFEDLSGKRFGRLVVLRPAKERRNGVIWECQCDCGNIALVSKGNLKSGSTRSCGCLRKEMRNDLAGMRFGKLVVVPQSQVRKHGSVIWECKCDCGNRISVDAGNLLAGAITSCGCLREMDGTKGE